MLRMRPLVAALACAIAANPGPATATPLDIESCDQLVQKQAALAADGIPAIMAKGPAWAKANASADKIEQVRQLIELEETIAFRCLRTRPLPPQSVQALPVHQPAVAAQPAKPKPKPKPVAAAPDTGASAATADQAAAPAPKPKPKTVAKAPAPKPADAFEPATKARAEN